MTTLYYFAGACSLVPHIVARELSLDIAVKAAPRPDDAGRAEYLDEINSLGKVPALQLDDAQVITQNVAIVEYMVSIAEAQSKVGIVYPKLGTLEHDKPCAGCHSPIPTFIRLLHLYLTRNVFPKTKRIFRL